MFFAPLRYDCLGGWVGIGVGDRAGASAVLRGGRSPPHESLLNNTRLNNYLTKHPLGNSIPYTCHNTIKSLRRNQIPSGSWKNRGYAGGRDLANSRYSSNRIPPAEGRVENIAPDLTRSSLFTDGLKVRNKCRPINWTVTPFEWHNLSIDEYRVYLKFVFYSEYMTIIENFQNTLGKCKVRHSKHIIKVLWMYSESPIMNIWLCLIEKKKIVYWCPV